MKLGDIIQETDIRNNANKLSLYSVRGVSIDKKFILTKANMEGVSLSGYKIVNRLCICYVPVTSRNGEKISLALNESDEDYIVSSTYVVLKSKNDKLIYMPFLNIYMRRSEFDRLSRFNSWGSARETLNTSELYEFKISLPSIKIQHQYADAYNALKKLAEQDEAMVKPLHDFCNACVSKFMNEYDSVYLNEYIEPIDERNTNLEIKLSQGISNEKLFINPKQTAINSKSDKIVRKGQFAYNRATTRNGEKISIAYRTGEDCTVSSAYQVFRLVNEEIINPFYLLLWFMRPEFDRYARYVSKGSAHEFFEYDEMCRVKIPLPPIEVQESIVAIYKCAEKARSIAERAREEMKRICPAMIQRAANL